VLPALKTEEVREEDRESLKKGCNEVLLSGIPPSSALSARVTAA